MKEMFVKLSDGRYLGQIVSFVDQPKRVAAIILTKDGHFIEEDINNIKLTIGNMAPAFSETLEIKDIESIVKHIVPFTKMNEIPKERMGKNIIRKKEVPVEVREAYKLRSIHQLCVDHPISEDMFRVFFQYYVFESDGSPVGKEKIGE